MLMEPSTHENLRHLPLPYRSRRLVLDPPRPDFTISTATAFKNNLYIGSKGLLSHYHLFEDAPNYMLLSLVPIDGTPEKLLILEDLEICLVLSNGEVSARQLPELLSCLVGKLKQVEDIAILAQRPENKEIVDKVVVFLGSNLRLLQYTRELARLLKEVSFSGAQLGVSMSCGSTTKYSNKSLVADSKSYSLVDLQLQKRIDLFEFDSESKDRILPVILPFRPQGNSRNEYLLPVRSDVSTTMAMFVDYQGEVTRGTLIWPEIGYPAQGMVVLWPQVISVHENPDKGVFLAFASLETLTLEHEISVEEDLRVMLTGECVSVADELATAAQSMVNLKTGAVADKFAFLRGNLLLVHGSETELIYTEELDHLGQAWEILENLSATQTLESTLAVAPELTFEDIELLLRGKNDELSRRCQALLALRYWKPEQFANSESLMTDANDPVETEEHKPPGNVLRIQELPELFGFPVVLFAFRSRPAVSLLSTGGLLWDVEVEKIVLKLLEMIPQDENVFVHIVAEYYAKVAEDDPSWQAIRVLKYRTSEASEIYQLILNDNAWAKEESSDQTIIDTLGEAKFYVLQLLALLKSQSYDSLISIGLDLLADRKQLADFDVKDGRALTDPPVDLIKMVFDALNLHINDSQVFTKKILELLSLHQQRGLELIQANKDGKHRATYRFIFEELAKSLDLDLRFSALRAEVIENAFLEKRDADEVYDITLANELADELTRELLSINSDDFENLGILEQTYEVENALLDSTWPKLSWIEFLRLHGPKSECSAICDVYVKLYEMCTLCGRPFDDSRFRYLHIVFGDGPEDSKVRFLFETGDYSTAEFLAIHQSMPLPREPRLLTLPPLAPTNFFVDGAKSILTYYLQATDNLSRFEAVRHFVDAYSTLFSFAELLELLPDELPLFYVSGYLEQTLVEQEAHKMLSTMDKALARLAERAALRPLKALRAIAKEQDSTLRG